MGPDGSFDLRMSPSKPFSNLPTFMSPPRQAKPQSPARPVKFHLNHIFVNEIKIFEKST